MGRRADVGTFTGLATEPIVPNCGCIEICIRPPVAVCISVGTPCCTTGVPVSSADPPCIIVG